MFTFEDGPRQRRTRFRNKTARIRASDIDPYIHKTMNSFVSDLKSRLNNQQQGLSEILDKIEYNDDVNPKHSPTAIRKIKKIIQPHISGLLFWVYDSDKHTCVYCDSYVNSGSCGACGAISVSYDVEQVDDVYLNLGTNKMRQINKFLKELQGDASYSSDEWKRIDTELTKYFEDKITFDTNIPLINGVLPGTNADMMKIALSKIGESIDDSTVYFACIKYWRWDIFDFSRYLSFYNKYINIIDAWCKASSTRMNKMFKYYWVSLIIGFKISRHYFRISENKLYISMISMARNISRSTSIPIPQEWVSKEIQMN